MHIFAEALWMPKAGSTDAEFEDAFWPKRPLRGEQHARFAVADGATETSFSGVWAKQLVRAYSAGELVDWEDASQLSALQKKWWSIVRRKSLPWYAEEKLEKGTFAALLGLTLHSDSPMASRGTWRALAVGDSCLFHLRGGSLLCAFPIQASSSFSNSPALLSTNMNQGVQPPAITEAHGTWEMGDSFYLMTDAIAAWFLREVEQQNSPWEVVRDWDNDPKRPFQHWVEEARKQKMVRNDDVTVYRIEIS
jgi:hypothetical protein